MDDARRPSEEDILRALAEEASEQGPGSGTCQEPDMLSAFMTGGLVPQERSEVEHHLARCAACRSAIADLARDDDLLEEPAGYPQYEVAPEAEVAPRSKRSHAGWSWAAAAALLLALGAWWLFGPQAPDAPRSLAELSAALRETNPDTLADLVPLSAAELDQPPTPAERGGMRLFLPAGVELNTRPNFRFAAQPGIKTYRIRVLSDAGDLVWSSTTTSGNFAYPEGQPALEAGENYLWEVSYERLGTQTARKSVRIAAPGSAEDFEAALAAIQTGVPEAEHFLLSAHLAIRRSHWSVARHLAEEALEARPDGEIERATNRYVLEALGE